MTAAYGQMGELDDALACGNRALNIAGTMKDLPLRVLSTSPLEQVYYYLAEYQRVVELATANLAGVPRDWPHEPLGNSVPTSVFDRLWLVRSLCELGRFVQAAEEATKMIALAEPTQHASSVSMAYIVAGELRLRQGDWMKARSLLERSITAARAGNVKLVLPLSVAASALVLAQLGEVGEATSRVREGEELLQWLAAAGNVSNVVRCWSQLGRAYLLLGQLDDARHLGERALASSSRHRGFAAHAQHLLGDIATHPERFDAENGEAHYREALALAEHRGMRPLVAHCHLGLGKLHRRRGDRDQAQEHLNTAMAMYREMGMTYWLAQVEAELRQLG
jgi:tetratricopeptide (TPR) repeat protein